MFMRYKKYAHMTQVTIYYLHEIDMFDKFITKKSYPN